jgi:hypothetical protein
MKSLFLVSTLLFSQLIFSTTKIDGVELNCLSKAAKRIGNNDLTTVCRSRNNPNEEWYTSCDGSGCFGFKADFKKNCKLSDFWSGQDDQDPIDPTEWKQDCLTSEDF